MPGGSFEATFRIIDEKSSRVIVDSIAWSCGGGVSGAGFRRFDPATDTEPLFSRSLVETIVMLHDRDGLDPPRNERDRSIGKASLQREPWHPGSWRSDRSTQENAERYQMLPPLLAGCSKNNSTSCCLLTYQLKTVAQMIQRSPVRVRRTSVPKREVNERKDGTVPEHLRFYLCAL